MFHETKTFFLFKFLLLAKKKEKISHKQDILLLDLSTYQPHHHLGRKLECIFNSEKNIEKYIYSV